MDSQGYPIPAGNVRVEQEVKRSRFIGALAHANSRDEAEAFIESIRQEHPRASHNCYAFVAGEPGNTPAVGMSDDGEPRGTAGKPMLSVLQHSGIGEIVVVVTRYFGGTKLGTGGLVRAYSGTLQFALDSATLKTKIELCTVEVTMPYACEGALRRFAESEQLELLDTRYTSNVCVAFRFPAHRANELARRIADVTNGVAQITQKTARSSSGL